jgi:hypothetical protein
MLDLLMHCYSALRADGGIRGGIVHGATDRQGAYVRVRGGLALFSTYTVLEWKGVGLQADRARTLRELS